MWTVEKLLNESDVEQKFVYPLLTLNPPYGFGYPTSTVQTKVNIKKYYIGKGAEKKLYFPDYILSNLGIPFLVVEVKSPSEDVIEGFRQARLYATELNSIFPHKTNPAKFVLATNGIEMLFGYFDQDKPKVNVKCNELSIYSEELDKILKEIKWDVAQEYIKNISLEQKQNGLFKVRRLLGGGSVQNEEVAGNAFAATVTSSISRIFNPETTFDRELIVHEAYITSKRRERYIEPIDKVIRAAKTPSETDATKFEDTKTPNEIINKLKNAKTLENKILLLIGSVGSGKSTFIDYLQLKALPSEVLDSTVWCRLNMNNAPVNSKEIYDWLRDNIIESCMDALPNTDFDDLITIKKIFGAEISKFDKGVGTLFKGDMNTYNLKLGEYLLEIVGDKALKTKNYIKFTCTDRQKLCVIVLDNCDKKTRDEQLLMFEAAQWLQNEFKSLVILPLRDETYDNHRDLPPLDTVLKDMVFRIEPPLFQHVLTKRINLALRHLNDERNEKLQYLLPNGYKVDYPKSEQAFYLITKIKSLFEHDRFARRLIVGLAGRNIRKALEIFLEFCNSGYISEEHIFKIRQSEGQYVLPFHLVATVLLRMNRRFYDGDHSFVKNIFDAKNADEKPSYFCRYLILIWLKQRFKTKGDARIEGYYKKITVKDSLVGYGLSSDIIDREINYLLRAHCIIAEHLKIDECSDEDLIRIGPAGIVHLDLIDNVNYLAALSEDTYFSDRFTAEEILHKINKGLGSHLHLKTTISNAENFINFIEDQKKDLLSICGSYINNEKLLNMLNFAESRKAIDRVKMSNSHDPWFDADKKLIRGSKHQVIAINKYDYGILVEFKEGVMGLVKKADMGGVSLNDVDIGACLLVSILWVDIIQKKIAVVLEEVLIEEGADFSN